MIDFYTWRTPNCQKVAIMLEEVELKYDVKLVDLTNQEQYSPDFLKINPNNKIPAITDHNGPGHKPINIFESGAILIYLAEKTGKFLSSNPRRRIETIQWLMFQMGGVGPMLGQVHHFVHFAAKKFPYAIERYTNEAKRLYGVMNEHLDKEAFFAGDYSIADMAIFPWVNLHERQRIELSDYPNLSRWHHKIVSRPAVQKGLTLI